MANILVVSIHDRSFIREDVRLLRSRHAVVWQRFRFRGLFCLIRNLRQADVVYIWFASYHAFLVTLLSRKPKVVVTGGYDVAFAPGIKYGLMTSRLWGWMVRFTLCHARRVLSVSEFNQQEALVNADVDSQVVYNSADSSRFRPDGVKKKNLVITVGGIDRVSWVRKGLMRFVDVAQRSHMRGLDFVFCLAGGIADDMRWVLGYLDGLPNLMMPGRLTDRELIQLYQKAQVYCQLSVYESFGVAVVEAMLCGCIPVVNDAAALPEVVGDCGFCVDADDVDSVLDAIQQAAGLEDGGRCREQVLLRFPQSTRGDLLLKVIDECMSE